MATIRPFKAIRPARGKAADIAALPYDVYNRAEAKEAAIGKPLSFLRIDRPEMHFPDDHDMYADDVYEKAHDLLWGMVKNGDFVQDEKPSYYIYELTMDGRAQTGIVACASVRDYENGVILRHENTRAEKEADRIRHVDTCNAQTGPIFLAYRQNDTIHSVTERVKKGTPDCDFTSEDGIRHRVFTISDDADIATIAEAFSAIERVYIADGHHRAASAVKVGQMRRKAAGDENNIADNASCDGKYAYEYFLSVLFPDEELRIFDYNRVVKDLNGLTEDELKAGMEKVAYLVREADKPMQPEHKGQFSVYLSDRWYLYEINDDKKNDDPVSGLDVSLLQDLILSPLLGIGDPKTDSRIDFVGGIRGLEELERRCHTDCAVAFAMYPTDISELFSVADAGLLMPPKSTWFEPKLRSGLFIHSLG